MHDDLLTAAKRRTWLWIVLSAVSVNSFVPLTVHVFHGNWAGIPALITWLVFTGFTLLIWTTAQPHARRLLFPPELITKPLAGRAKNIAEGIAIATGRQPVDVVEVEHPSINVGIIPDEAKPEVFVTTGALERLTRDELEALCAMQVAATRHTELSTLMRCAQWVASMQAIGILLCLSCALLIPMLLVFPPMLGITMFCTYILLYPRIRWWLRAAADGATIATTKHPYALASALRKVAADEYDRRLLHRRVTMLGDAVNLGWVAPITPPSTVRYQLENGYRRLHSTRVEDNIRLLQRARLVTDVCTEGERATAKSWKEVRSTIEEASKQLADNATFEYDGVILRHVDGIIEPKIDPSN